MRAPDFWEKRGAASLLLAPVGALYGASVAWKARHARPHRVRAKVICVGNLTAGGSGKTPVALAIGARLLARGRHVFFLTRGYGGGEAGPMRVADNDRAEQVGDEALLLAGVAPTILSRDRARGADLAVTEGADIIVMDDGHQNFSLAKDLSLVVVDGETGFGNGRMIPAGPLREPVAQGLARADAVIVMGPGRPDLGSFHGPVLKAELRADPHPFQRRRVFAFAGIGRPEKFVGTLKTMGATIQGAQFFSDHHMFKTHEIMALKKQAGDAQLVTTEKDFARLRAEDRPGIEVVKVRAIFEQETGLDDLLERVDRAGGAR